MIEPRSPVIADGLSRKGIRQSIGRTHDVQLRGVQIPVIILESDDGPEELPLFEPGVRPAHDEGAISPEVRARPARARTRAPHARVSRAISRARAVRCRAPTTTTRATQLLAFIVDAARADPRQPGGDEWEALLASESLTVARHREPGEALDRVRGCMALPGCAARDAFFALADVATRRAWDTASREFGCLGSADAAGDDAPRVRACALMLDDARWRAVPGRRAERRRRAAAGARRARRLVPALRDADAHGRPRGRREPRARALGAAAGGGRRARALGGQRPRSRSRGARARTRRGRWAARSCGRGASAGTTACPTRTAAARACSRLPCSTRAETCPRGRKRGPRPPRCAATRPADQRAASSPPQKQPTELPTRARAKRWRPARRVRRAWRRCRRAARVPIISRCWSAQPRRRSCSLRRA